MIWTKTGKYVVWFGTQNLIGVSNEFGQVSCTNQPSGGTEYLVRGGFVSDVFQEENFLFRTDVGGGSQLSVFQEVIFNYLSKNPLLKQNFENIFSTQVSRAAVTQFYPEMVNGILFEVDLNDSGMYLESFTLILRPEFRWSPQKDGGFWVNDDMILPEILHSVPYRCLFGLKGRDVLWLYYFVRGEFPRRTAKGKIAIKEFVRDLNQTYNSKLKYSSIESEADAESMRIDRLLIDRKIDKESRGTLTSLMRFFEYTQPHKTPLSLIKEHFPSYT